MACEDVPVRLEHCSEFVVSSQRDASFQSALYKPVLMSMAICGCVFLFYCHLHNYIQSNFFTSLR